MKYFLLTDNIIFLLIVLKIEIYSDWFYSFIYRVCMYSQTFVKQIAIYSFFIRNWLWKICLLLWKQQDTVVGRCDPSENNNDGLQLTIFKIHSYHFIDQRGKLELELWMWKGTLWRKLSVGDKGNLSILLSIKSLGESEMQNPWVGSYNCRKSWMSI